MSERESWEKRVGGPGPGQRSGGGAASGNRCGGTETGAEQSFAEEAEERARAAGGILSGGWKKPSTGASVIFV